MFRFVCVPPAKREVHTFFVLMSMRSAITFQVATDKIERALNFVLTDMTYTIPSQSADRQTDWGRFVKRNDPSRSVSDF